MTSRQSSNITLKQKFIKQSNNYIRLSTTLLLLQNYTLKQASYRTYELSNNHDNSTTFSQPYQGSCSATTACSPPLIRRRSMELSCSKSRSPPPPKASAQLDVSISGSSSSSSSAASSPPPVSLSQEDSFVSVSSPKASPHELTSISDGVGSVRFLGGKSFVAPRQSQLDDDQLLLQDFPPLPPPPDLPDLPQ